MKELRRNSERYAVAYRWEESLEKLKDVLKVHPNYWVIHWTLGEVYTQMGMHEEGIAAFQKTMDLAGEGASWEVLPWLGWAYGVAGRTDEARQVLQQLEAQSEQCYVPAYFFAQVYAGLGENDLALDYLEKAYEEHDLRLAWRDTSIDSLREEPRFIELGRKVGFIK
ncbi:MAG: tetratricopeptide repeat protein [Spirochaetaceae bacterium]|nr:MAG: tetratricopeptide repeat protein [Spirochaetaceae bacterium]